MASDTSVSPPILMAVSSAHLSDSSFTIIKYKKMEKKIHRYNSYYFFKTIFTNIETLKNLNFQISHTLHAL